jgi:hypothetical protein
VSVSSDERDGLSSTQAQHGQRSSPTTAVQCSDVEYQEHELT